MVRKRSARRGGFTLIEVVVAIAVLAILASITAFGVSRVLQGQHARNTDATVSKLQKGLDQQWSAVLDDARNDKNPDLAKVLGFCGNNRDCAKAFLAYAYTLREFPQSFTEAATGVAVGGLTLPPRKTFASVPNVNSGNTDGEAAVLLYLILAEKGYRGVTFAADDVTAGAQGDLSIGGGTFRVFKDAYGTPITFRRWLTNNELSAAPYLNPKTGADPLDPLGKLAASGVAGSWPVGVNKAITVVAAGPNQGFEWNPTGVTDDVYGYRLRRLGNKGE